MRARNAALTANEAASRAIAVPGVDAADEHQQAERDRLGGEDEPEGRGVVGQVQDGEGERHGREPVTRDGDRLPGEEQAELRLVQDGGQGIAAAVYGRGGVPSAARRRAARGGGGKGA